MAVKLRNFELPKKIVFEEETTNYGKIVAEPFEKGYGVTIGNSLRRILLSSIEGTAITKVKIDGVLHEFSTIPGVMEDVSQVIMNLKGVVLSSHFKEPKPIFISVDKKGEVTAKDIQTDDTVQVINTDHHIATLTENKKLEIEMTVERGRGYVPAERNKSEEDPIGVIPIDALFSPVKRVNIDVMETRVGHITDYDKLILEVWTNGSMEPKDTLLYAADNLQRHLDVFMTLGQIEEPIGEETSKDDERSEISKLLSEPISNMELSVRSSNCLAEANIRTLGDLVRRKETEMLKYKNFGKKSLTEINNILSAKGLHLGMEVDELIDDK